MGTSASPQAGLSLAIFFSVEPRTQFQHCTELAVDRNAPLALAHRSAQDLQQGRFSRTIPPDNADRLTPTDFNIDI